MNYNQFSESDKQKFAAYRCLQPGSTETTSKSGWYRVDDSCPCNPVYSNISGRGFQSCTFGLTDNQDLINNANLPKPLMSIEKVPNESNYQAVPTKRLPQGSVFPQNQFVPSSYEPRPLIRIGNNIRSAWS